MSKKADAKVEKVEVREVAADRPVSVLAFAKAEGLNPVQLATLKYGRPATERRTITDWRKVWKSILERTVN